MKYYYVSINDSQKCLPLTDEEAIQYLAHGYTLTRREPMYHNSLYVTLGCRAGIMDVCGEITLPKDWTIDDHLCIFAEDVVSDWVNHSGQYAEDGISFDQFIEDRLKEEFAMAVVE